MSQDKDGRRSFIGALLGLPLVFLPRQEPESARATANLSTSLCSDGTWAKTAAGQKEFEEYTLRILDEALRKNRWGIVSTLKKTLA